jgi:hypothetical protein
LNWTVKTRREDSEAFTMATVETSIVGDCVRPPCLGVGDKVGSEGVGEAVFALTLPVGDTVGSVGVGAFVRVFLVGWGVGSVGEAEGPKEGGSTGLRVGRAVFVFRTGALEGANVGDLVTLIEGLVDGRNVTPRLVGAEVFVGLSVVGRPVVGEDVLGESDGEGVGEDVSGSVGASVGCVGCRVGPDEGASV